MNIRKDSRNANKGTQRGADMVRQSLEDYGAGRSILVDKNGVAIAGNKTFEKAQELGIPIQVIESDGKTLYAIKRTDLDMETDDAAKQLGIADNRSSELGLDWDADVLRGMLDEDIDLSVFWSEEELSDLLGIDAEVVEYQSDPDDVPEPPDEPITRPGDLWQLGPHRLLCGDCTSATAMDRLMAGAKATLVFTDPPYGVDYDGGTKVREKLASDHKGTDIYGEVMPLLAAHSDPKAPMYIWHAGLVSVPVLLAIENANYQVRSQIIWNKNQAQFGALTAQYKQKHEPCWYIFRKGQTPYWYGPTNEVSVWDIDRASVNEFHPTQKPVALAIRAMANSSQPGDLVLDAFLGSGSTLIAAEQEGRTCYGMELDPRYCDVIIRRWEEFTGKKAVLNASREA